MAGQVRVWDVSAGTSSVLPPLQGTRHVAGDDPVTWRAGIRASFATRLTQLRLERLPDWGNTTHNYRVMGSVWVLSLLSAHIEPIYLLLIL